MKIKHLKQFFAAKGDESRPRRDTQLPLNMRLGSRIRFSEASFLLSGDDGGIEFPGDESLVGAYSECDMAGLAAVRLYLKDRKDPHQESMLMVVSPEGASGPELFLFREMAEIPLYSHEPEGQNDPVHSVAFWLDEHEGILGMPEFNTPEGLAYGRLWAADSSSRLDPVRLTERVYSDPYSDSPQIVEHLGTMLYARSYTALDGDRDEFLLPAVEKDDDGFRVIVWRGIPLSVSDIELPGVL